jgi:hypothetical protein
MNIFQRRPLATSVVGGVLFGMLGLVVGGGWKSPAGIGLAILIGAVFAISMYRGLRRQRPPR